MKKSENFLVKLLVGVVAGAVLGLLIPQGSTLPFAEAVVNIVGTVKYILGQLINFCVPLIIIGFIAGPPPPSPSWAATPPGCWAWPS